MLGLLPYLNEHALDDDYARVAARPAGGRPPQRPVASVLIVALFVVLLLTAASQTSRNAASDLSERKELIRQIERRQDGIDQDKQRLERLRQQVVDLRGQLVDNNKLSTGTRSRLSLLAVRAGTVPVQGPGVTVTVDDAEDASSDRNRVLDGDLQQLVNGLWEAGAEAIAVDGERLTNLSAIRQAGGAITVNYSSLEPPYVVEAIGDPDTLPTRFADTTSGQTWLDLQQQVGLEFDMRTRTSLRLPAAPTPRLRFASTADTEKSARKSSGKPAKKSAGGGS